MTGTSLLNAIVIGADLAQKFVPEVVDLIKAAKALRSAHPEITSEEVARIVVMNLSDEVLAISDQVTTILEGIDPSAPPAK